MGLLLATFGYMALSAVIPVFNAEAYLAGVAATVASDSDTLALWLLGLLAGAGQMLGKLVWYLAGRHARDWAWLRRKTSSPKWQASLEKWRHRIGDRWWFAAVILLVSAVVGLPPFAVLSLLAGQLRVPLPVFLVVGVVGRTVRFGALLTGVQVLEGHDWIPLPW